MHIGVCTISSKSREVEEVLDIAADLGADGVEVWGQDHIGDGSPERCRAIAEEAANNGLEIPVYGSYLRAGTDAFADDYERELRIAEDLGAEYIRVWAGQEEHPEVSDAHRDAVFDDLTTLGEAAADTEVDVTVERHAGTVTNTTEGARETIDATPPTVGLNWQPMGDHTATEVSDDITALAEVTNNVHIQTKAEPNGDERCPLAFSYFDIADIVSTLDDAGFDGYVEVEFVTQRSPYPPALAADVAFLDTLLADLG